MKVLVATREGQGHRRNDFCHAEEGELVGFAFECDGETVDGNCGCRRSMSGLTSRLATTTMKVVERPDLTVEGLAAAMEQSLLGGGWFEAGDPEGAKMAREDAEEVARLAGIFPLGAVVEKRGSKFQAR